MLICHSSIILFQEKLPTIRVIRLVMEKPSYSGKYHHGFGIAFFVENLAILRVVKSCCFLNRSYNHFNNILLLKELPALGLTSCSATCSFPNQASHLSSYSLPGENFDLKSYSCDLHRPAEIHDSSIRKTPALSPVTGRVAVSSICKVILRKWCVARSLAPHSTSKHS